MNEALPRTTAIFFQTDYATRHVLAIAAVSAILALPTGTAMAGSRDPQPPAGKHALIADTPMQRQMLRIERQMKKLQDQMQTIRATTNRQERYKLLLDHIKGMRETLGMLSGMEVAMVAEVERGQAVSDASLKRRQAILDQLMSMMQIMLEQLALQQEPGLYK